MKKNANQPGTAKISFDNMAIEEYLELQKKFDDPIVFEQAREALFNAHPDCPRPKPIERLDLVMRKEFALEILDGTKTVEIRSYSNFYCSRLYDKIVLAYEQAHWDDELMRMMMIDFNDSVRAVKTIHFHDYGKTWFLDVECIDNSTVLIRDDQVGYLQEQFNCHEFDEELAELNAENASERPIYFYFAVGKVLGTDLK